MAKKLAAVLASAALFAAIVANAAPAAKAKNPKCSVCKMELASTKSKKNSVAVKVGKKTYYCCEACPMGKKTSKNAAKK